MSEDVSELVNKAVQKKREGEFESSLNCYLQAIDTDYTSNKIYLGLGKTAYLLGNPLLSLQAYLSAMHIEMNLLENQMVDNQLPDGYARFYEELPEELKELLPRKYGVLIFADYNIAKHLGHTYVDYDPDKPEELEAAGAIYRSQIQGLKDYGSLFEEYDITSEKVDELDTDLYTPTGQRFLLQYLEWDEISDLDVISIYFNEERTKERFNNEG